MKSLLLLILIITSGLSIQFNNEEKNYLQTKKIIKIHLEKDWEPYNFVEDNEEKGFVNDYLKLIEDELPIKFEFSKAKTWNEHLEDLKNKKIDVVSNMIKSKKREELFNFNENLIFTIKMAILSKHNYESFEDLKNKKIGTMEGFYINSVLKEKYPEIEVIQYKSVLKLLEAVLNNKVDAITEDYSVLTYLTEKLLLSDKELSINIVLEKELVNKVFMATNKDDKILPKILDKAIKNISKEKKEKLYHKWHILHDHKYLPKDGNILSLKEIEFLKENKSFTVCSRYNHFPISQEVDNKLTGIAGDILNIIEKNLNIQFNILSINSDKDFISKLESNQCDLITLVKKDQTKFKNIKTTNAVFEISFDILSSTKSGYIKDIRTIKNDTFYTKDIAHYNVFKKQYPNLNIVLESNLDKIMKTIEDNPNAHLVQNHLKLEHIIKDYGFDKFKINGTVPNMLANGSIGINIKHNPILVNILNKKIDEIGADTLKTLVKKYEIKEYEIKNKYNKELLWIIGILILLGVLNTIRVRFIKNEKRKFESLLHNATDGVHIIDNKGNVVMCSDSFAKILGYTKEEALLLNRKDWEVNTVLYTDKQIEEIINKNSFIESIYRRKDKTTLEVQVYVKFIYLNGHKYLYASLRDVSLQKEYERTLKNKEEELEDSNQELTYTLENLKKTTALYEKEKIRFENMFRTHDSIMILVNPDTGMIIDANQSASKFYGYSLDEFKKMHISEINHLSREEITEAIKEAKLLDHNSFVFPHRLKNNEIKTVEINSSPIESEEGTILFSIIKDITKEKELEKNIIKEKQRYQTFINLASDAIFIMDIKNGNLLEFNKQAKELLGYTKEEMKNLNVINWDKDINSIDEYRDIISHVHYQPVYIEREHVKKDGEVYTAAITAVKVKVGEEEYIFASARDISKEKEAQFRLENTNRNLEKFVDTQDNIVFLINKGQINFANKKFLEFVNCKTLEEFKKIHNCISEYFIENDRFFHLGKVPSNKTWIETLKFIPDNKRVVSMVGKDFNPKAFSISINDFDKDTLIVTFTDISNTILENIELENKVIHDKLTNAYNREFFEQNYQNLIYNYHNETSKFALALLDIDHFKMVNDNYGHDVGDDILIKFVELIHKYSRRDDILIRWGGEEFILLLKVTSKDDLLNALEHLREVIKSYNFKKVGHKTCSIGATIYRDGENIQDTIKRADEKVYKAKNTGRNKVVI
ncbi:diguanylate cyclase [Arcobacter sp. YIC-464]|uniref:diguanylate cyclase n=1 Tax=Arcobacter sp. YIC-464 TaxID=3376631 RepID=UPI003C1DD7F6